MLLEFLEVRFVAKLFLTPLCLCNGNDQKRDFVINLVNNVFNIGAISMQFNNTLYSINDKNLARILDMTLQTVSNVFFYT